MRRIPFPLLTLALCAGMLGAPAEAAEPAPLLDEFRISGNVPLTIEDFVAQPQVEHVVLSPGGTRLVVVNLSPTEVKRTVTPEGKRVEYPSEDGFSPRLSFFTIPSMQPVSSQSRLIHGYDLASIKDIRWASDTLFMYQLGWPRHGFSPIRDYVGSLRLMDMERRSTMSIALDPQGMIRHSMPVELHKYNAEIDTIAAGPLRVVEARMGAPDRALIQTTRSRQGVDAREYGAFELNVRDGVLTRVAALPVEDGRFITGPGHRVALVTAVSAQRERLVYYLPPGIRAKDRSNPRVSNWQLRVTSSNDDGLQPIAWTGRAEEYYALDGRDMPTRAVVLWNAELNTVQTLYRHPEADMDAFALDPTGRPWMFSGADHYSVYWYPDPEHPLAQLHSALAQRLPHEHIEILNATDDYAYAVARISAARRTPVFLVLDVKSIRPLRAFSAYPQLDGTRLSPVDAIEFRARDDTTIRGYLTTPLDAEGNPRRQAPLVVIAREGPQGASANYDYEFERQMFAAQGYAVLQVNHRGLRGRGAEFANPDKWRREAQEDIADGVRWAIQDGVADAGRVCFYGFGYGAWSALTAASRDPGLFKCAIGLNGTYETPLIDNAGSIKAKVLLMHHRDDVDFPIDQASRMRRALRDAGNAPQWEEIRPGDAGLFTPATRASAYRKIFTFLDQQLGR